MPSGDITAGRKERCKNNVGGVKNVFFVNYDETLFSGATVTDEVITALGSAVQAYKYEVRGANGFDEENNNSRENGSSFWAGTGTIVLKKQDSATQKELKLLSYGRPHVLVEDYNGNFRLAGAQNGVEFSVSTSTGGAMGDLNGYNITFEGKETTPALFVDAGVMGDVAGFTINATVINP